MKHKILVVEDEIDINDLVKLHLDKAGFTVDQAYDGADALHLAHTNTYDLFILDYMLPYMNGVDLLKRIRLHSVAPVLFLTARTDDEDKETAFSEGADDYIEKPFSALELVFRVKASIRRYTQYQNTDEEVIYKNGDFKLYPDTYMFFIGDEEIRLNHKAFKILEMLMSAPGRIFTKEQIYETVWGETYMAGSNTIMVHMSQLRDKIEENPKAPKYIKTIKGLGYRMEKVDEH